MSDEAIWTAHARVTDIAALERLLEPIPADIAADVRVLATPEGHKKAGMRWSAQLHRAYYLQHDADGVVSCITFGAVPSFEKAAELWAAIDDQRPKNMDGVCAAYAAVMGIEIDKVVRY